MYLKKTTFSATVSGQTAGANADARVLAESAVMDALWGWLAANLPAGFSEVDHFAPESTEWAEYPAYTVNASGDIKTGAGTLKQTTGIRSFGTNADNFLCGLWARSGVVCFGMLPSKQVIDEITGSGATVKDNGLRVRVSDIHRSNMTNEGAVWELYSMPRTDDAVTLEISYWKGPDLLVFQCSGDEKAQKVYFVGGDSPCFGVFRGSDGAHTCWPLGLKFPRGANTAGGTSRPLEDCLKQGFFTAADLNMTASGGSAASAVAAVAADRLCAVGGKDWTGSSNFPLHAPGELAQTSSSMYPGPCYGLPAFPADTLLLREFYIPLTQTKHAFRLGFLARSFTRDSVYRLEGGRGDWLAFCSGCWTVLAKVEDQGA